MTLLNAHSRHGVHLVASVLVIYWCGAPSPPTAATGQWGPAGGHLDSGDASLSATAAPELLEEAVLLAHFPSAPINVGLSTYRCRTAAEPVLHLDVCFAPIADVIAPTLVVSDGLAEPNPSISEVFQHP